jgi:hypothetical protein
MTMRTRAEEGGRFNFLRKRMVDTAVQEVTQPKHLFVRKAGYL